MIEFRKAFRGIEIIGNQHIRRILLREFGEGLNRTPVRLHIFYGESMSLSVCHIQKGICQCYEHHLLGPVFLLVVYPFYHRHDRMQEDAVIQIVLPIEPDCIGIIGREQLECACHERVVDAEHSVNVLFLFIDLPE